MSKELFAVGRRKTAVARVKLVPGSGQIVINDRKPEVYLPTARLLTEAVAGLELVGAKDKYDIHVRVHGGGVNGQAEAIRLGISRALQTHTGDYRGPLKKAGFLRRDPRMVERKKYGLHKARRATQFSKR